MTHSNLYPPTSYSEAVFPPIVHRAYTSPRTEAVTLLSGVNLCVLIGGSGYQERAM